LLAPIISWVALYPLCLLILISSNSFARQSFQFNAGDNVQVLSDKAYRKSLDNLYEAVGNVIITQGPNSIYGEKATLSFETGEVNVVGNVRYVGPGFTMYGSRMTYNLNTQQLSVNNARVLSDNYVILGNTLSRTGPNEIYGKDAEYTTCRDCPESWTVFGKEVRITVGEYIRIKHAFIKVKGVVVMYFPYIILPIKKDRQTGLLFPSFGLNIDEGARFQQPFFWNISPHADATVTPSFFGNRGWGSELEFRHDPFDGLQYQTRGLFTNDTIYRPGKSERTKSGRSEFRYLGQWEHHYSDKENFNHHFNFTKLRDYDLSRDYQFYTDDKLLSPDSGLETFFDYREDLFNFNIFSGFRTNHLYREAREFDNRYVQILPKLSFDMAPITLFESDIPMLNRLSFSLDSDFTMFRQNHLQEDEYIRNANRLNAVPRLLWNFGDLGPISAKTQIELDYQDYRFDHLERGKSFRKYGVVYETEFSLVLDKIFGLAYKEEIPKESVVEGRDPRDSEDEKNENLTKEAGSSLIGELPPVQSVSDEKYKIIKNSYRHRQEFKLKHYFLSKQFYKGNSDFYDQIQSNDGRFDTVDTIRSQEFQAINETSRTTLPINNTLEIQWNNTVTKKSVASADLLEDGKSIRNNFNYSNISYFNVSQGFDLHRDTDALGNALSFKDRLTRLYINTGFSLKKTSFSLQEYYYYSTGEHITRANVSRAFSFGNLTSGLRYNSFRTPVDKFYTLGGNLYISDEVYLTGNWEYNIDEKRSYQTNYGVTYRPSNDCWMLQVDYNRTIAQRSFGFNFLINFSEKGFAGM
tara:strand:+ start:10269 stop:12686 length:2418 start_codon:yes stop_codon:yes gene_type:complete